MNFPIIYDKLETNFNIGYGLGILENAYNVKVKEVVNGECTLSFSLPYTDEKMAYVSPLNIVKVEGQLFRIKKIEDVNNKGLICNIRCEHISAELSTCKFIPLIQQFGVSPTAILHETLADTPFILGACEISTLADIDLTKASPMDVISKLIELVGGELERNNYTISLRKRRGSNSGVQFRVGKNIQTITRKTDISKLITRLYPFGEDDLDISTVNSGLHYIDSSYINDYPQTYIGHNEYRDIKDPTELKNKALSEFSTEDNDGIDKPQITYSVSVVELKKLKEYGDVEVFYLGDTVKVIDETLGIDSVQRVMEYERYPYEPNRSSVVLSNVSAEYYKKNTLNGVFANIKKSSDKIQAVTNGNKVVAQYVDNIREKLQTEVNEVSEKVLLHNTSDMYVDNVNNPTKAMLLGAGIFAVANSKKLNGDWNWRTIGTADKFVADEVDANWVYTGGLSADQITVGKLSDSQISSAGTWNGKINADDAVTIIGSTVTAPFVNALNIQAKTVASDWIYAGSINANQITAGKITASQIDATNLHVSSANIDGTIVADSVASNWVYAGNISANQINTGSLSADRISGGTLSGVTLNVSTDATVGSTLYVGQSNITTGKSIVFSSASGYNANISYLSGDLELYSYGYTTITSPSGIYLNSTTGVYYNNSEVATLADLENTASSIVVSDTEPTDTTKIWIDISNI